MICVAFSCGVIELIIMPAVQYQFVPTLKLSANTTLSASDATAFGVKVDSVVNNMHLGIYLLMFILFVYLMLSVFKREDNEMYQP